MSKIKHSKFKNTGILFELLVRQITNEVLNNKRQKSQSILKEFFGKNTELSKELRLYNLLMKEKYTTENRAEKFIDLVCEEHIKKINYKKLRKEKYNLVKAIKENISNMDGFLSSPIQNYREMASIYKIFESKRQENYDIKDVFNSKFTIVEHVMKDPIKDKSEKMNDRIIKEYQEQDKDLRLLAYKILVENFNKKYTSLNEDQRNLLRKYINNVTNTTNFNKYLQKEIPNLSKRLNRLSERIDDKVTKIKLNETANVVKRIKIGREVKDNEISALMMAYELIKEIQSNLK